MNQYKIKYNLFKQLLQEQADESLINFFKLKDGEKSINDAIDEVKSIYNIEDNVIYPAERKTQSFRSGI